MASRNAVRTILLLIFVLSAAHACLAETIVEGSSLDEQELLNLGIDPAAFLFTGNTMYDFNGIPELNIIAADINPLTVSTLTGVTIESVTIQLADLSSGDSALSGQTNSNADAPEPATWGILALGILGILVLGWRGFTPERRFRPEQGMQALEVRDR